MTWEGVQYSGGGLVNGETLFTIRQQSMDVGKIREESERGPLITVGGGGEGAPRHPPGEGSAQADRWQPANGANEKGRRHLDGRGGVRAPILFRYTNIFFALPWFTH